MLESENTKWIVIMTVNGNRNMTNGLIFGWLTLNSEFKKIAWNSALTYDMILHSLLL
jgi:hypothetical protein